jgi:hypothetical protein
MNSGGARETMVLMTAGTGKPVLDAAEFEALYQRARRRITPRPPSTR